MLFTIISVLYVHNLLLNNKIVNNNFLDLLNTAELRLKSYTRILYPMFDVLFVKY